MIQVFFEKGAQVVRSRDPKVWAVADILIDVGGEFDPARRRFDHHQGSYLGNRSSAGMVLDWLAAEDHLPPGMEAALRPLIDYVDRTDIGVHPPSIESVVTLISDLNTFGQSAFLQAVEIATMWLRAISKRVAQEVEAREILAEMLPQTTVVLFDPPRGWEEAFFDVNPDHPALFMVAEDAAGNTMVRGIPTAKGSFSVRRPLPEEWAGLLEGQFGQVVPGGVFCHKARFLAIFTDRASAMAALDRAGLLAL